MHFIRKLLHSLVYSNIFIAACAVLMTAQTAALWLPAGANQSNLLLPFVFSSTLCTYSFHYFFTSPSPQHTQRNNWSRKNRPWLGGLFVLSLAAAIYFFIPLLGYWQLFLPAALATLLYTAPQLPHPLFYRMRKYAYGKTIMLALIWTYVTAALPLLMANDRISPDSMFYIAGRYFFIYCICILFDYRDREADRRSGVKSLITYFSETGIHRLFVFSWLAQGIFTVLASGPVQSWFDTILLLIPALILLLLYRPAKNKPSDLLYLVYLDGLMALSAVLMLFARI